MRFKNKNIRHGKAFTQNLQCSVCKIEFLSIAKLAIHVKIVHEEKKIKNSQGGFISTAKNYFQAFHKGKKQKCGKYEKEFSSNKKLLHHAETVDEGKNTKKPVSCMILPAQKWFQYFHEEKKNQCSKCNEEFLTKKELLSHVESAHEGKKTNCLNCKIEVEEGEKHQCTYQCTICNEEFSTKNELVIHRVNHIESVHEVKKGQLKRKEYKCVGCNIEFCDQVSFNKHILTVHSNLVSNGIKSKLELHHGFNVHQPLMTKDVKLPPGQSLMPGSFGPPSGSQYEKESSSNKQLLFGDLLLCLI